MLLDDDGAIHGYRVLNVLTNDDNVMLWQIFLKKIKLCFAYKKIVCKFAS